MSTDYIDKLAYIYIRNKKLLCTLPKNRDTWLNAGGKREAGESDQEALIREVREELSVDLLPKTIRTHRRSLFVSKSIFQRCQPAVLATRHI